MTHGNATRYGTRPRTAQAVAAERTRSVRPARKIGGADGRADHGATLSGRPAT